MYTLKITSQFKKDLKRIQNNPTKILHLKEVLRLLEQDGVLPERFKPHKRVCDYAGFIECHVESDLLLIWLDPEENVIKLVRLGTHSELFK
jgi:mRNA interferase YafQ